MPRSFAALVAAVVGLVLILPAQALAGSPSSTAAGGMTAKQLPSPPREVPGEQASLTAAGLAIPPASAPQAVKDAIAAGNRIARKPYRYGGGHGRWLDSGYDCSGSVSFALRGAGLLRSPLDSSGFMRWGQRGRGAWITIRSNPGHAYMIVAGLRFDTSARRIGGSRWTDQMRSARGFRGTHPVGL